MTEVAFAGAIELGLVFGFVALGIFISFRVLNFPDLTADGSFPLGAAVAATGIASGYNPSVATVVAVVAGAVAGLTTGVLSLRFKILGLLAGILTMTALFSINLRVMGKPNIALLGQATVFTWMQSSPIPYPWGTVALLAALTAIACLALWWFLCTDFGLAMRATGVNARMARANGVNTDLTTYVGLAMSNALIALSGALFAQANAFADVTIGIGTIVVGLASVILGETLHHNRTLLLAVFATIIGSLLYRLAVQLALSSDAIGLRPSDLSLITAVLVAVAMVLPQVRSRTRRLVRSTARSSKPAGPAVDGSPSSEAPHQAGGAK